MTGIPGKPCENVPEGDGLLINCIHQLRGPFEPQIAGALVFFTAAGKVGVDQVAGFFFCRILGGESMVVGFKQQNSAGGIHDPEVGQAAQVLSPVVFQVLLEVVNRFAGAQGIRHDGAFLVFYFVGFRRQVVGYGVDNAESCTVEARKTAAPGRVVAVHQCQVGKRLVVHEYHPVGQLAGVPVFPQDRCPFRRCARGDQDGGALFIVVERDSRHADGQCEYQDQQISNHFLLLASQIGTILPPAVGNYKSDGAAGHQCRMGVEFRIEIRRMDNRTPWR